MKKTKKIKKRSLGSVVFLHERREKMKTYCVGFTGTNAPYLYSERFQSVDAALEFVNERKKRATTLQFFVAETKKAEKIMVDFQSKLLKKAVYISEQA